MNNEITINVEELLKADDNSITDYETIRQISLLGCTQNNISKNDKEMLCKKVKKGFECFGLYPTVINSFDIHTDFTKGCEEINELHKKIQNKLKSI